MQPLLSLDGFRREPGNTLFEHSIDTFGRLVYSTCYRILGDGMKSEEASQAVFLTLAEHASSRRVLAYPAAWLHRQAVDIALIMQSALQRIEDTADSWTRVAPLIDREINGLPDKQRIQVVGDFLLGQDTEDMDGPRPPQYYRGLETVRERLAQTGIVFSLGSLAGLISSRSSSVRLPDRFTEKMTGSLSQQAVLVTRDLHHRRAIRNVRKTIGYALFLLIVGVLVLRAAVPETQPRIRFHDTSRNETAPSPGTESDEVALKWRELGTPEFYRTFRPKSPGSSEFRFSAWWQDPDYAAGWERKNRRDDSSAGIPMTDFDRYITAAIYRKCENKGTVLSVRKVVETRKSIQVHYTYKKGTGEPAAGDIQVLLEIDGRNKPVLMVENGIPLGEVLPFRKVEFPKGIVSESDKTLHIVCRSIHECVKNLPLSGSGKDFSPVSAWPRLLKIFFEKEMVVGGYFGAVTRPALYNISLVKVYGGRLHIFLELSVQPDAPGLRPGTVAIVPRRDIPVIWYVDGEYLQEDPFVVPSASVNRTGPKQEPVKVQKLQSRPVKRLTPASEPAETGAVSSVWGKPSGGLQMSLKVSPLKWDGNVTGIKAVVKIRNITGTPIRIVDWALFGDGLEVYKDGGRKIRCMQFARKRVAARVENFPVIKPGETREFSADGDFGPSRSDGWYSLTMDALTGIRRRWSISEGRVTLKAVFFNSSEKDLLSSPPDGLHWNDPAWIGRVESNPVTVEVGGE